MNSLSKTKKLILLPTLLLIFFTSCSTPKIEQQKIEQQKIEPVDIFVLPLNEFPDSQINELVVYCKQKFNLTVTVLPRIPVEERVFDNERRQVIAEELIEFIKLKSQPMLTHPKSILIGMTSQDMYIRQFDWRFAFTCRQGDRFAVISSARMDPVNFGERPDESLMLSRLRKMFTKNIGLLYFKLPQNNNPKSVLYSGIGGVDELDAVGEDF